MKLLFKQRFLSWPDSYDIYYESGDVAYTVEGQFGLGHCLKVFDHSGNEVGMVQQQMFTLLPKFDIHINGVCAGCISKEFSFFVPAYNIDYNGWHVDGDFFELEYRILSSSGEKIAQVSKEIFNWTDTYIIDVNNPADALSALMLVIAIDAEKCSRK